MRKIMLLVVFWASLAAGCSYIHPYHVDIQQGRKLKQSQLKQLKKGMSKSQVASLLGKPLLDEPVHNDRWSYVYYHRPTHGSTINKRLVVYFKNDRVSRIDSDYQSHKHQ